MKPIGSSELIISSNNEIYHLGLKPEQIAEKIILVGDQNRVDIVASFFSSIECTVQHREFRTITGHYKGVRISVVSTGIGTDNIDIVLNELDALVNIDFKSRLLKEKLTRLQLVRLGTSGSIQPEIPVGSMVVSSRSIGFDNLIYYYDLQHLKHNTEFEDAFIQFTGWTNNSRPYVVDAAPGLFKKLSTAFIPGINISAPGFFGPQGRVLRLKLHDPALNQKIEDFRFKDEKVTNYEMESSAIYALGSMLGHDAATVCAIIANRRSLTFDTKYQDTIRKMIEQTLDLLIVE